MWRESLLAKAVLRGETRGYTRHPQLDRFRSHPHPRLAINTYLAAIEAEAARRGYGFDRSKIGPVRAVQCIPVSTGQLDYEWVHLRNKLALRNPVYLAGLGDVVGLSCHPLFQCEPGDVAVWERV